MKKTVFISVSNPLIVRNFLLIPDGVFSFLKKERNMRIVLLVPKPAFGQMKQDFESGMVIVEPLTVDWKRTVPQRVYTFFSTYLIFTEMQQLLAKYGTRADIPAAGGKRFLYPLKLFVSKTFGKWGWFKHTVMPAAGMLVYGKRPYKVVFEKHKPDIVFLPDFHSIQDTAILWEAKRRGIRTIGMPGSWDHFVKKFEPMKLDTLLVWNKPVRNEALTLQGYRSEDVFIVGAPYYDIFTKKNLLLSREAFCKIGNFDPKKKIIFFGSRGRYTPDDADIVAILLDAIKTKRLVHDAQIFVRPYPGAGLEEKEKFMPFENEPPVFNDWIETRKLFGHSGFTWYPSLDDLIRFMNCLHHADIIINTYSSISIEGSVFLKPIININFDGYKKKRYERSVKRFENLSHFKHVNSTRGIDNVFSADELVDTVNAYLKNPKKNEEYHKALRDLMCFTTDGKAGERIAGHILKFFRF